MTGILEDIHARLGRIEQLLSQQPQAQIAHQQTGIGATIGMQQQPQVQQAGFGGAALGGGFGGQQVQAGWQSVPVPQGLTDVTILSMIQPYLENQQIKDALSAQMKEMGINALPETQPHQYNEMYQRFAFTVAQFGGTGAGGGQPQSII
jgi:hypothetical protein